MKVDNSLEGSVSDNTLPELKFPINSVHATHTLLISKYARGLVLFVLFYFVFVFLLVIFYDWTIIIWPYLFLPPGLIIGYRWKTLYAMVEKKFFEQFAAANNYSYKEKITDLPLTGALFIPTTAAFINNRKSWLEHVIEGEFNGHKIRLFCYCQEAKDSAIKRTVLEIDYNINLPKMFLKPDWHTSYVKPIFKNEHHLSLEGDFDHHFDLYVEREFEIEALQIFTPDIMHRLQTDWRRFVVEFSYDTVFIYTFGVVTKKKDLEHMYMYAQYLIGKLSPIAKRMEPGLMAMQERFKR
jgi:hypothetical protein